MTIKQVKLIKNVGKNVLIGDDGLFLFRKNNILEKYSHNFDSIWSASDIICQYEILENSRHIVTYYPYEIVYTIDKNNGTVNSIKLVNLFPKHLTDRFIFGVIHTNSKKAICQYNIINGELTPLFDLLNDQYCSSANQKYAILGEKSSYKKIEVASLESKSILWEYEMEGMDGSIRSILHSNIVIIRIDNGYTGFKIQNGEILWRVNYGISAFDKDNGLVYVLGLDYLVIDALTGEEVVRVSDWRHKQLPEYPALEYFNSNCTLSENYLVFSSKATSDEFGEGGIFIIDKITAQVKEYFRIVFDKDPFQRKGWYGNMIPDDQQIPFMPMETPIYKDGRLYVVLPSAIEGQNDLYVYELEE